MFWHAKKSIWMNTLNAPVVANIALLILGYLNKDSKLYFPKLGDESLGWAILGEGGEANKWYYGNNTQKKEKNKQTHKKKIANFVFSISQSNIKIAKNWIFLSLWLVQVTLCNIPILRKDRWKIVIKSHWEL